PPVRKRRAGGRLVVKEVLVGANTIALCHSIPIPQSGPGSNRLPGPPSGVTESRPNPGYLLRSGSGFTTAPTFTCITSSTSGRRMAEEVRERGHDRSSLRGRHRHRIPTSGGGGTVLEGTRESGAEGITSGKGATDRVWTVRAKANREERGEGEPGNIPVSGVYALLCGDSSGRILTVRKTIGKRLRAKLREIEDELRKRWHEPI